MDVDDVDSDIEVDVDGDTVSLCTVGHHLARGPKSRRLSVLNRKAVGGGTKFDTFYNARLDSFIDETSPLKSVKQEAAMDLTPKSQSEWNVSHIYSCSLGEVDVNSRFSQLGVDSDHKASILSGLTKIDGFWKYLTDVDVETSKEKSFTLVRSLQTKKTLPEIKKSLFAKLLMPGNSIDATHVVTSVTHGIILASVFYCDEVEGIDFEKIKELTLLYVKGISIRSDWNTLQSMGKQLKVRVYADPMFQLAEEMNFKDAIGLMKSMDKLLKRTPDGLGHCLEFDLAPLKHFIGPQLLNPMNVYTPQTSELDLSTIEKVVVLVQQSKSEYSMTEKGYQQLINYGYIFSEEVFKEQQSIKEILADMIHSFEDNARQLVRDIRYESFESVSDMKNAYEHLETQSGTLKQKFKEIVDQVDERVTSKVRFAMELDAEGVPYVGRHNTTFEKELSLIPDDGHCYVLLYTPTDKKTFKEQYKLFKSLFDSKNKCIFIDLEVAEKPNFLPTGTCIVKFRGKKPIILNYFEEEIRKKSTCIARLASNCAPREGTCNPVDSGNLVPLKVPCPKALIEGDMCPNEDYAWECDVCGNTLRFNKTTVAEIFSQETNKPVRRSNSFIRAEGMLKNESTINFYCDCGYAPAEEYVFRCKNLENHGFEYTAFSLANLRLCLKQLIGNRITNLLVVGEIGVGKSTWINNIVNFTTYKSLDEAIKAKNQICLTPKRSNTELCNGDKSKKRNAEDSNTDQPSAYELTYEGRKLRIINVPSFGDGPTKDCAKFNNVVNYIAKLKELHGICVLLKPNHTRLPPAAKYYINELMACLHHDVGKNFTFMFTHARETNYRPGGTLPLLKELFSVTTNRGANIEINSDNTYYIDNEAFRYLYEVSKNITQTQDYLEACRISWKRSDTETKRLFKYISGLQPHDTTAITSLYETRRTILLFAKPLAVISDFIQTQILDLKDDIGKVELLSDEAIKELNMENTVRAIKENESEQVVISEIAARLGSYLNHRSIQPGRDAIQACIEQTFKEYEMLALVTDDYQKLEAMKTCLKEYVEQKQMFDNALQSGNLAIEPGDIKKYFDRLISLKRNGNHIKKLVEYEEKSYKNQEIKPSRK